MGEFRSFLAVALVVIVTPGQDTALTLRNTLRGGRAGGILTAVGVSAGQATWALASSVGVGAVVVALPLALAALRLAGSAYLVLLGVQALLGAVHPHGRRAAVAVQPAPARLSPRGALRQGLLSNLGNPKMLAFFTGLLPQFARSPAGLLALGLVFCVVTLAWLTGYAFAVARASTLLRRPGVRRPFEALTGTTLVALGVRLATERLLGAGR